MSTNPITRDLGRKAQREMNEVLSRNLTIASHVLGTADLLILTIEAAVSVVLSAASTAAASTGDSADAGSMFDLTVEMISTMALRDRPRGLAEAAARRAKSAA